MGRDLLLQSLHSLHPWSSCRRYDHKDAGDRIASGTAIESNAGAIAEGKIHFPYFAYPSPNPLSGEALFALYEIVTNDVFSILEGHSHQHQFALRQLYLIIST
jgi:hypothetical protein